MSARGWRSLRRQAARDLVRAALAAHPEAPMAVLARCAGVGYGRLTIALAELETTGEVTARWIEGPYPRRRAYRLAESAQRSAEGAHINEGDQQ